MGVGVIHEVIEPLRDSGKSDVKVDTCKNNIARASIDKDHSTVPVA